MYSPKPKLMAPMLIKTKSAAVRGVSSRTTVRPRRRSMISFGRSEILLAGVIGIVRLIPDLRATKLHFTAASGDSYMSTSYQRRGRRLRWLAGLWSSCGIYWKASASLITATQCGVARDQ